MDETCLREDFKSETAFQGYKRLENALMELNYGGSAGLFVLTPERREEMLFWALLRTDPLIEAYDKLPIEIRESYPPLPTHETVPKSKGVLDRDMAKLERSARLFVQKPEIVIEALKQIY